MGLLSSILYGKDTPAKEESNQVKIYTLPACGYCKQVKRHLDKHNIPYQEINLKDDKDGKAFMKARGYTGVPVTVIGDEEIVGFDLDRVDKLLGIE